MSELPDSSEERPVLSQSPVLYVMLATFAVIGLVTILATAGPPDAADSHHAPSVAYGPAQFPHVFSFDPLAAIEGSGTAEEFPVPPPPFNDPTMFPCSDCHEGDPGNPRRRNLREHQEIVLEHDEEHRWCLDCHLDTDRDSLRLASGAPVPFEESYRLCGQCHGTQYRDWRNGAHGKRTGYIEGPRAYMLCVNCHDPHSPAFDPIQPLPPPVSPHFYATSEVASLPPADGGSDEHP